MSVKSVFCEVSDGNVIRNWKAVTIIKWQRSCPNCWVKSRTCKQWAWLFNWRDFQAMWLVWPHFSLLARVKCERKEINWKWRLSKREPALDLDNFSASPDNTPWKQGQGCGWQSLLRLECDLWIQATISREVRIREEATEEGSVEDTRVWWCRSPQNPQKKNEVLENLILAETLLMWAERDRGGRRWSKNDPKGTATDTGTRKGGLERVKKA